jgi:very-short-patch-repair endonuclease
VGRGSRKHRLCGRKFRRQHSIRPYLLDFHCPVMRLAVELDGGAHDHEAAQAYDRHRETYLARHQIRVLRFINDDVETSLTGVAAEIETVLDR